jgi:hypothetical protein
MSFFGKAAEKDRFATANPSCGELAACALQTKPIPLRQSSAGGKLLEESSLLLPSVHEKK